MDRGRPLQNKLVGAVSETNHGVELLFSSKALTGAGYLIHGDALNEKTQNCGLMLSVSIQERVVKM